MRLPIALAVLLAQPAPPPVTAEFRVFAGTEEITASTRLRIMPTGRRDTRVTVGESERHTAPLAPGIYDVQALRIRPEGIVAIRWAERLVVMHYPDEGGRHLEVINFEPGYGALQVRAANAAIADFEMAAFPAGNRSDPPAEPFDGDEYRLFVLKSGRWDIRVRPAGNQPDSLHPRWLLDIEVPADRTRLKIVEGS